MPENMDLHMCQSLLCFFAHSGNSVHHRCRLDFSKEDFYSISEVRKGSFTNFMLSIEIIVIIECPKLEETHKNPQSPGPAQD